MDRRKLRSFFEKFDSKSKMDRRKEREGRVEGMKTLILVTRTRKSSRNPTVGDG